MDKVNLKIEDNALMIGVDTNEDGENVVDIKLSLNEALQEALKKGEEVKIEDAKKVSFSFGLTGLEIKIDTDQDGEEVASVKINLPEAIDEAGLAEMIG